MEYNTHNDYETKELAKDIASSFKPGQIIALVGELGSGKTTFVKGIAQYFGLNKNITSPTFVIVKRYELPKAKNGIKAFTHIDCYRISSEEDARSLDLDYYLNEKDSIVLIEWPEVVESLFPKDRLITINFLYENENERIISTDDIKF